MSKGKILSYATTALEFTKMVLVITANTAVKLAAEGKKEIIRQYTEYNQKMGQLKAKSPAVKSQPPPSQPSKKADQPLGISKIAPPKSTPDPKKKK